MVIVWPMPDKKNETKQEVSYLSDGTNGMFGTTGNNGGISTKEVVTVSSGQEQWDSYTEFLESTLEEVLLTMEGAGKVKVMITLEDSGETVVEKDITTGLDTSTQVDADGASHNTGSNEKTGETVYVNDNGESVPYVRQVLSPKVKGVLVSAQGGGNQTVNKNITEAIQALFGIEAHKIKIIKMSSE